MFSRLVIGAVSAIIKIQKQSGSPKEKEKRLALTNCENTGGMQNHEKSRYSRRQALKTCK